MTPVFNGVESYNARMTKKTMQFLFGDRELLLTVEDLLSAPVDVIVNAANSELLHSGGVAGQIVEQAGEVIQEESNQFVKEHGPLESGMVALTSAGDLPFLAVLHAVGPRMGEGDEQDKVMLAVSRCLKLCSMHDWESIAFPAISTGIFNVPVELVAEGFFHAITSYWDARVDEPPGKIIICLTRDNFQPFFAAFRGAAMIPDEGEPGMQILPTEEGEMETGIVVLNDGDILALEDDQVNEWFK